MKISRCCWLGLLVPLLALAGEPVSLRLVQALQEPAGIQVYLDLRDAEGIALRSVALEQLTATVGAHPARVDAVVPFAETGEGVARVFLVDISKSLKPAQFAQVRAALLNGIEAMGEQDQAALLSFGTGVKLRQDFTPNKMALKAKVMELAPSDEQTFFHQGLLRALEIGSRLDEGLPKRRVIVTLTDGLDDTAGGVTADEVLARLRETRIPIYAIGFASPPVSATQQAGLKALGEFARRSGGQYLDARDGGLETAYADLRRQIGEALVVHLRCADCVADGRLYRIQIVLSTGGRTLSQGLDLRLLPQVAGAPPAVEPKPVVEPEPPLSPALESEPTEGAEAPPDEAAVETAETPPAKGPVAETTPVGPPPATGQKTGYLKPPWLYGLWASLLLLVSMLFLIRRRRSAPARATEMRDVVDSGPLSEPAEHLQATGLARPGIRVELVGVSGPERGKHYPLRIVAGVVLGRAPDCDLVFSDDDEVSGHHCTLELQEGTLVLRDLGSTNGTVLNGVPLAGPRPVREGDRIQLSRTEVRVYRLEPAA
jgi:hypothetical protein